MVKAVFMYVLALVVLLAPAIILGWIGWTLLDWPGLIAGILIGLAIFVFSMNKIASQEGAAEGAKGFENSDSPTAAMQEAGKRE